MSWNNFTFAMGNITNLLRATNTALKKDGNTGLGDRLQDAGMQLFGNSMALRTARDIRNNTYSSAGYTGFFAANGNADKAMKNTTDAALWAYQTYTPMFYYNNYNPMGMSMLNQRFGQQATWDKAMQNLDFLK